MITWPPALCFRDADFASVSLSFDRRGLRQQNARRAQQMIRMHFVAAHHFHAFEIARAQFEIAILGRSRPAELSWWPQTSRAVCAKLLVL